MARPRPLVVAALLATVVAAATLTTAGAQSLSPSGAPSPIVSAAASAVPAAASAVPASPGESPAASAATADCHAAVALLPASVDDLPLESRVTPGVAAIDPDELLDPLLTSLGRARSDVCVVAFRYGAVPDALAGQLLRIAGADEADLARRFTDALRAQLVAYGAEASPQVVEADGRTIWSTAITADGARSQVVVSQLGDILLLTSARAAMDRVLPLLVSPLVKASTPEP